jgi:hypothetical protein
MFRPQRLDKEKAEHAEVSFLRQLGHLSQDPPLSVPPSRMVWLYRETIYIAIISPFAPFV